MAHTKAKGSTRLGRDSASQRLGVKLFGGQKVRQGQIIVRQRGTKWLLGAGVKKGGDDTIYARKDGVVQFKKKKKLSFSGSLKRRTVVEVI